MQDVLLSITSEEMLVINVLIVIYPSLWKSLVALLMFNSQHWQVLHYCLSPWNSPENLAFSYELSKDHA